MSRSDHCIFSGPPDPVRNLEASKESNNQVLFSWSPSFSPYSVLVTYQVEVEDEGNVALIFSEATISTSLPYTYPEGFCSVLNIRIRTSNKAGKSSPSDVTYSMLTRKRSIFFIAVYTVSLFRAKHICHSPITPTQRFISEWRDGVRHRI